MSISFPEVSTNVQRGLAPRQPTKDEVDRIAHEIGAWSTQTANVNSVQLFTHPSRPTIRCAIVSRTRDYDAQLDDAVSEFDLRMAANPDLRGVDFEVRLFFAAAPEQVAAWARGWEPLTDAEF